MNTTNQLFQKILTDQKVKVPTETETEQHTPQELENIATVTQFVNLNFSHDKPSISDVKKLLAENNEYICPVNPDLHTLEDAHLRMQNYADISSDFRIVEFNQLFAKGNHVAIRLLDAGTHDLKPFKGIEPSGKKATSSGISLYVLENGKIKKWYHEVDKGGAFKQLGFPFP
jgi:predicted ester cyclase